MCKLTSLLLCLFFFVSGCASQQRFYAGKALPKDAVAIISGSGISGTAGYGYSNIQVTEINGKKIELDNMIPNSVELLPGKYQIKIYYHNVKFHASTSFELDAKAGEKYLVNFNKEKLDHFLPMSLENIWLENLTTKNIILKIEKWSKVKATYFDPGTIYIRM